MQRKVALLGSREGHWIRTSGMTPLRLNSRVSRGVLVAVIQHDEDEDEVRELFLEGPGLHLVGTAVWSRVKVVDGSHIDALCLFEGG